MLYSKILGTGSYLPDQILTNKDLEQRVDTTDDWIISRTGIKQRHVSGINDSTLSMSLAAATKALEAANLAANDIDLIIVATSTPDKIFPSVACYLQNALNIKRPIPAFDVAAACSGFMYALSIADQFIKNSTLKHVLILGSESLSRAVDWQDRGTCILFGDGAGAVVLGAATEAGIYSTHLHSAGEHANLLYSDNPLVTGDITNSKIRMDGNSVFKLAVKELSDIITTTLAVNHIDKTTIDWLIPHQANLRIIQAVAKNLSFPEEKVIITLENHGNTSAASVPLALDTAIRDGRIQRGQLLMLEAFGGGLTWGSALIRY